MTRFITANLFDSVAAAGASVCQSDEDMEYFVSRMSSYQETYADEDLGGKWKTAVLGVRDAVQRMNLESALAASILQSFAWYVKRFDRAGKRIPFYRRFGGTKLHFERQPVNDLPGLFIARFLVYATHAELGHLRRDWIKPGA